MQQIDLEYFATLIEEQRQKQLVFDTQIQLELLSLTECNDTKDHRQYVMVQLANRIVQINHLLEPWLNAVKLNIV